jgi:hypothetical protein
MNTKNRKNRAAAAGAIFESGVRSLKGVRAARDGATKIINVAEHWRNTSAERIAGRVAEELHAATFNIDASTKGFNALQANTGSSAGMSTAPADVTIGNAGKVIGQVQVKYHATATSTTFDVAKVKYDGMQRVVPSDQAARVRELARKRGVDGLRQRNYPEVAKSASDRIRAGEAQSTPLSRAEALDAAKNPRSVATRLVNQQTANAVKNGAIVGAAVGGGVSAITNLVAFADGEKSGRTAFVDTLKDTTACAATGAAVSGAAVAAEVALVRVGAGALAASAAPVAIAIAVVEVGKDVARLCSGDISGEKFVGRAGGHFVRGGIVWGGMEGGAALGTLICPGFGTIIGGIAGGIAGGLFGGWLFD